MSTSREVDAFVLNGGVLAARQIHPGAIGVGVIDGTEHRVKAEIAKMEKRGEVIAYRRYARRRAGGIIEIPYVRLREHSAVQREHMIRWAAFWVGVAMTLAGVLYALWTIRIFILVTLVCVGVAVLVLRFLPHLSRGCSGIHCSCCRG